MMCALVIQPDSIRTGTPITVTLGPESGEKGETALVRPLERSGAEPFVLPLVDKGDGHRTAQFTLSLEGSYEIAVGKLARSIVVERQRDLAFGLEMGIFSLVVAVALGGMIVWLKRSKSRGAGAAPLT